jgi:hypothetical protein
MRIKVIGILIVALLQKIFSRWRIEDIRYCNDNGEEQNPHALNHWQRMIAAKSEKLCR